MHVPYLNASYSVFSYAVRRMSGISFNPPLPPAISVELSSRCNLSCHECVTGAGLLQRRNDFLSVSLARKIASELRSHTLSAWLYFQGEPMMHPRFFDIMELFREMHPVISTNGHFLDAESCTRLASSSLRQIIIPYDGVTPGVYNIYRKGGDHAVVTEGIRRLAVSVRREGTSPAIEIQFLLHRGNEHEVSEAKAFAKSIGAGFKVKSIQVLDTQRAGEWMPSDRQRSRYTLSGDKWKTTETQSRGCMRMWTTSVITSDGDVVPCCFDKNASHVMGNLNSQSFRNIWQSEKYVAFRKTVMKSRREIDICRECPEGRRIFFKD